MGKRLTKQKDASRIFNQEENEEEDGHKWENTYYTKIENNKVYSLYYCERCNKYKVFEGGI